LPPQAIAAQVNTLPAGTPVTVFLDIHDPGIALLEALSLVDGLRTQVTAEARSTASDLRCVFDYAEEPSIKALIERDQALQRILRPLPSLADCVGADALFESADRLDVMARRIHAKYDADGSKPWEKLSSEDQDSNRAAADHISIALRFLAERGRPIESADYRFDPADLEALAECEHRRWAAQKLMAGWVPDATLGEGQDKLRKRHGCLARPYGALSEQMRQLDRNNVTEIPLLLSAVGGSAPVEA